MSGLQISRFAEVNKEWWLLLSLFVIAGLLNWYGGMNFMLLFLYVLPTLFSAYFFGQRHATLTAFASVFLVVLGLFFRHIFLSEDLGRQLMNGTWYQVSAWAGILVLCGYATGRLFREMHESYRGFLLITRYFLTRDGAAHDQVRRLAYYSVAVAEHYGMSPEQIEVVRAAALLHHLSELEISPDVILKASRLTETGATDASTDQDLARLRNVLPIVLASGKSGKKPIEAAIIDLADEYDGLTTGRNRARPMNPMIARSMIAKSAGTRYDARLIAAFEATVDAGVFRQSADAAAV